VRLVLLGPPGAGKGTQAARLAAAFDVAHLSSGQLLREAVAAGTALGRKAKPIIERGELVPDALVGEMIAERIKQKEAEGGFILDGYPRTLAQAEALERTLAERGMELDAVLHIAVEEGSLLKRILQRAEEAKQRGEAVRMDDDPAVFEKRMARYRAETAPLIAHYREAGKLRTVDGGQPIDRVTEELLTAIGEGEPARYGERALSETPRK
jgi:adenylate kinase